VSAVFRKKIPLQTNRIDHVYDFGSIRSEIIVIWSIGPKSAKRFSDKSDAMKKT